MAEKNWMSSFLWKNGRLSESLPTEATDQVIDKWNLQLFDWFDLETAASKPIPNPSAPPPPAGSIVFQLRVILNL